MSDTETLPFASIMIPVWNPNPKFLKEAVFSVLSQDVEGISLHIAVVDDDSQKVNVPALLQEWGVDKQIEYHRNDRQLGIGGNWNRCIELSKGEWIHIFHQDDVLLDGFYQKLKEVEDSTPSIKSIFSRNVYIDENGYWRTLSRRERQTDGFIDEFLYSVHESDIQCPSVVVKKDIYEELGLFNSTLAYALDKEMWARIASKYSWYYLVNPLSCFRIHDESQSHRVKVSNSIIIDVLKGAEIIWSYMDNPKKQQEDEIRMRKQLASTILQNSELSKLSRAKSAYQMAPYLSTIKKILRSM